MSDIIQLVPKNSRRILLSDELSELSDINSENPYIIDSDSKMQQFISDYNKIMSFSWGDEGVVDWEKLKQSYTSINFIWYKDFWNCSDDLQNSIELNSCWEWYANIEQPCIYIW